jgi:hypothetical protein
MLSSLIIRPEEVPLKRLPDPLRDWVDQYLLRLGMMAKDSPNQKRTHSSGGLMVEVGGVSTTDI